jgi:hypothetical protein
MRFIGIRLWFLFYQGHRRVLTSSLRIHPYGITTKHRENSMKESQQQIKDRLDREIERMKNQEWHGTVWKPTITEQELQERQKQIERGILPF